MASISDILNSYPPDIASRKREFIKYAQAFFYTDLSLYRIFKSLFIKKIGQHFDYVLSSNFGKVSRINLV